MMDSSQLRYVLGKYNINAKVICRDELPNYFKLPIGLIANTDPCSKPGQHWVGIFIDQKKNGYYFDSFGFPPIHEDFVNFLNKHSKKWNYNSKRIQSLDSDTCGQICLIFLLQKFNKLRVNELFSNNTKMNDNIAKTFINFVIENL